MAYAGQALKIDWTYTVTGTPEIADTGFKLTSGNGWTGAAASLAELSTGDASDLLAAMATLMNDTHWNWAGYSVLSSVKVSALDTAGHYLADPLEYESTAPVSGTAGNIPAQNTVVASLRSGFTLGRANYGRMYIPHTVIPQAGSSPYAASTNQAYITDAVRTFVNSVSTIVNASITAVVAPAIMSSLGSGLTKPVTQVAVGRVGDTQRRRRNKLTENYVFTDLA